MRIISGFLGGRRFSPSMDRWPTRPTTDQAREALFNILHHRVQWESTDCLDLFGGTGSLSLECISRGARSVHYVERYTPACKYVSQLVQDWEIEERIQIHKSEVMAYIERCTDQYDLILADPPYAMPRLTELADGILEASVLRPGGTLIIEHGAEISWEHHTAHTETRAYGQSRFSFFTTPDLQDVSGYSEE